LSTAIATTPETPPIATPTYAGKDIELARSTVYLELSLHALGDKRKVPAKDMEVGEADKALFRLSKRILESESLASIHSFDGKTRDFIYDRCHPFKRGVYFLPYTLVEEVHQELLKRRAQRNQLVSTFLDEYPDLCRNVASRLTRKYYNAADYAPVEAVAARFGMSWQIFKFGVPDELATVNPAVFAEARQQAAAQVKQAAEHIEALMREQALKLVAHLRDRLQPEPDGRKKKLHETALTNLAEFLAYFDHKNVTRNDELKAVVDDLRAKLANKDIEAIKSNDSLRERLGQEMSAIAERLETMVERVPKRRIILH
jgi:hypothetical protein